MVSQNIVKTKLLAGQPTLGCWNLIGHPVVAEILAQAGFDWLTLDVEHGVMDWPQVVGQMQAMQGTACMPLVRLPANRSEYFKWALDGGAMGVIVPMVATEEEARRAVAQAKYPPQGTRGAALARAHAYGADFEAYVQTANQQTLVVVMIEQAEGVENIEAICAVPGVDAVLIGPYDLSGSLGVMGQLEHPDVQAGVRRVLEAAQAAGVAPGLHIADPKPGEIQQRIAEGFRLIGVGLDTNILRKGARQLVSGFERAEGET